MNPPQPPSQDINVGHTNFIAAAGAWNEAQTERSAQLPELLSESGQPPDPPAVKAISHGFQYEFRGQSKKFEEFLL